MERYEYMKILLDIIPKEIIQKYNLINLSRKSFVYMETQNGMYGISQAGKITNGKLKLHLSIFGYKPAPITPGLWWHQTPPLQFSLVVNDFAVKYERQEDIQHLLNVL